MTPRRSFGHTWWGQAWLDALEQQARLDPSRLPRGRTYARKDHVGAITTEPGSIRTQVKGSRPKPYDVELTVRTFSDDEWRTVFEVIMAKVEHIAALLDGELNPDLVDDTTRAGVDLLPRAGEVEPRCSCPDWARPCKHSAAVCYLVADEIDDDPFVLLQLRGRTRDQVLATVRRLRAASAPSAGDGDGARPGPPVDDGVPAAEAWVRALEPLPTPPALRARPGRPTAQSVDPPADATFTADGLHALAADAAARAWSSLAEGASLDLDIGMDDDTVRRAVTARNEHGFADIVRRLGTSSRTLARKAVAWELGERAGLAMLNEPKWRADPLVMSAARLAVEEVLRGHVRGEIDGNRLTVGDTQLRLSRSGQWWSFQKKANVWQLIGGPVDAADELIDRRPAHRR